VTFVGWRSETLALEHMTKVTSTSSTSDLDAFHAQRTVYVACHGARDGIEEGWPAAAAVELCVALVERGIASRAGVESSRFVMLVFTRPGSLGALRADHPELLGSEDGAPFFLGLGLAIVGRHLSNGCWR